MTSMNFFTGTVNAAKLPRTWNRFFWHIEYWSFGTELQMPLMIYTFYCTISKICMLIAWAS